MEMTPAEKDLLNNLLERISSKLEKNDDNEWTPQEEIFFALSEKQKVIFDQLLAKINRA